MKKRRLRGRRFFQGVLLRLLAILPLVLVML